VISFGKGRPGKHKRPGKRCGKVEVFFEAGYVKQKLCGEREKAAVGEGNESLK